MGWTLIPRPGQGQCRYSVISAGRPGYILPATNDRKRRPFGIEIVVWPELFIHAGRGDYFDRVHDAIRESTSRTLWLFDPDTGIEPARGAKNEHVSLQELACVYALIPEGDYVAVYQHHTRRPNWQKNARQRLSEVLGGHAVELYRSEVTGQAVMLAIRKQQIGGVAHLICIAG